jgi:hypothetical protein
MNATVSPEITFNSTRDFAYTNESPGLNNILHVFDADWHGIRNASGASPGHKLTITNARSLTESELRYVFGIIYGYGLQHIIFQGYSNVAAELAFQISAHFGSKVRIYVLSHVNASAFQHVYELEMLKLMGQQLNSGILHRVGSVKPDFQSVVPFIWPKTVFNFVPLVQGVGKCSDMRNQSRKFEVFVPLGNTFGKNLYVNIIAAHNSDMVDRVFCVNWPAGLDRLVSMHKLRLLPFRNRAQMFELLSRVDLVMNVTFAECQPMTQLEAIAVGTPCLTGPLKIEPIDEHPLSKLCTVNECDNPKMVCKAVDRVLDLKMRDPDKLNELIVDFKKQVNRHAVDSYNEFIFG